MPARGRIGPDRIQIRRQQGGAARPCATCGTITEHRLADGPTGGSWCCRRCGHNGGADYVFDPRRPPVGEPEFTAAAACLVQHVMALRTVDPAEVLAAVRDHFEAGWCVRDVVHAMNYRPDGEQSGSDNGVWSVREPAAKTRARLTARLAAWRWSTDADGNPGAVMPGDWTATQLAMTAAALAQEQRRASRDAEWRARAAAATPSSGPGATAARVVAAAAASRGRLRRLAAVLRDRAWVNARTGDRQDG